MRYELGLMDMYPIEAGGSKIENNPMYRVEMNSYIDPVKLEDSVYKAMRLHPLFTTRVEFDKNYYLTTNNRPIRILHCPENKRPLMFGKFTNGYPWQICWYENHFTFEWCHGISDGVGAMDFLKHILDAYCDAELPDVPREIPLGFGLEPFYNRKEKGVDFNVQPQGFSFRNLKINNRGYKTDCHVLKASTSDILSAAKENGTSVSLLISILMSKALKQNLPASSKNRNVACNLVMDLRRPLEYETMHNCVEYKRITYTDEYDSMDFKDVAKAYKDILDNARIKENVVRMVSDRVSMFESFHIIKTKNLRKTVLKQIANVIKDTDCNFVTTYLGKTDFSPEVMNNVSDIQFRVWHDFGECILACMDYKGEFTINLCENLIDKTFVKDFIYLSAAKGINWTCAETCEFTQAQFIEEDSDIDEPIYDSNAETKEARNPIPLGIKQPSVVWFNNSLDTSYNN